MFAGSYISAWRASTTTTSRPGSVRTREISRPDALSLTRKTCPRNVETPDCSPSFPSVNSGVGSARASRPSPTQLTSSAPAPGSACTNCTLRPPAAALAAPSAGAEDARSQLSHARAQLESMYPGFARHSPAAAQPAQFGFWSMHAAQPAPSPAAAAAKSTRRIWRGEFAPARP